MLPTVMAEDTHTSRDALPRMPDEDATDNHSTQCESTKGKQGVNCVLVLSLRGQVLPGPTDQPRLVLLVVLMLVFRSDSALTHIQILPWGAAVKEQSSHMPTLSYAEHMQNIVQEPRRLCGRLTR